MPKGYGQFWDGRKKVLAHRWAYAFYIGEFQSDLFVCHKCDNPSCVNPEHLFLGTNLDNVRDMMNKGRHSRYSVCGEMHPMAKLKKCDVENIRVLISEGLSHREIANKFGVSKSLIGAICQGKIWTKP
jgi:hypothetical protein